MSRTLIAVLVIVWAVIAIGSTAFVWSHCGVESLLLGNGGFYAAVSGMCD